MSFCRSVLLAVLFIGLLASAADAQQSIRQLATQDEATAEETSNPFEDTDAGSEDDLPEPEPNVRQPSDLPPTDITPRSSSESELQEFGGSTHSPPSISRSPSGCHRCDADACLGTCASTGCSTCGAGLGFPCECSCNPVTLQELIYGPEASCLTVGGWFSGGYHSNDTGLFNTHPDRFQAHQMWLFLEKNLDTSCGWDWGFRADGMYGVDAQNTQAFGNPLDPATMNARGWDNDWDYGIYGWSAPQLYGQLGNDDVSVKIGHFYTTIGYEVVPAPDNFFYSHSITMNNTEPFTHTGVLASMQANDCLEVSVGWTAGWDTGFDQFGSGSSFLGGLSYALSDHVSLIWAVTAGDFGVRGSDGYMQSVVLDVALTESLQYVLQSDSLRVGSTAEDIIGLNQYLFYSVSDCLSLGTRVEWWKSNGMSFYEATAGLNIRPHANFVIRPEFRKDWVPGLAADRDHFGIDIVMTF